MALSLIVVTVISNVMHDSIAHFDSRGDSLPELGLHTAHFPRHYRQRIFRFLILVYDYDSTFTAIYLVILDKRATLLRFLIIALHGQCTSTMYYHNSPTVAATSYMYARRHSTSYVLIVQLLLVLVVTSILVSAKQPGRMRLHYRYCSRYTAV